MSKLFSPFHLPAPDGGLTLSNRIMIAPMCQYSCEQGLAADWHLTHWTNMFNSGASAFIIEATAVTEEGKISPYCLGLWDDITEKSFHDTLVRARQLAPNIAIGIQLSHAGRKGSSRAPWDGGDLIPLESGGWQTLAPSAIPHSPEERAPVALDQEGLNRIKQAFVDAALRAKRSGVDFIELHAAHGYLLHQFLSPLSNQREDQYGGSLENRIRFPLEVFKAVRDVYAGVLGVRISATDWADNGWDLKQTLVFVEQLKSFGISYIHVSTGGLAYNQKITLEPGYQVPFAKVIKEKTGIPTVTVGLITKAEQAEEILQDQGADLIAFARAFLYQPRWAWQAAAILDGKVESSKQYWRSLPKEAQNIFTHSTIKQR